MSNYTPSTNFATKDALSPGDPLKIVRGTEINTEFTNIAVAVATKFDTASLASPGPIGGTTPAAINGTTGTFSGDVQMASANGGQLAGLRNKIINGDMRVAQRGTVSSGISTVTYTLDRWIVFTGGASLSVGQSAGDGASFQYALNVVGAGGNTTCNITQRIEQRNAYPLASKQVTVSARIYASASFTPTWSVDSANTADAFAATTNVATGTFSALAIGWNDVTFTTTLNSACQNGFQVSFLMGATTSGNKGLTGVQLEVGPIPTIFEQIPIGLSLQFCQRYYEETAFDIPVSGNTAVGMWAVEKRATPTLSSVYSVGSGGSVSADPNAPRKAIRAGTYATVSASVKVIGVSEL